MSRFDLGPTTALGFGEPVAPASVSGIRLQAVEMESFGYPGGEFRLHHLNWAAYGVVTLVPPADADIPSVTPPAHGSADTKDGGDI
jgi:hypothetical protein